MLKILIYKIIVSMKQKSANSGPRAKCGPQRHVLRPTKYFSAKNILLKNSTKKVFVIKT